MSVDEVEASKAPLMDHLIELAQAPCPEHKILRLG